MRPTVRAFLSLAAIVAWSCTDATTVSETTDPWSLGSFEPSSAVLAQRPAVCGPATLTRLLADEVVPVGTVEVTQDDAHLYVTYETDEGWPISKTAVFVGASAAGLPLGGGGNPKVGQFPYKAAHDGLAQVVWEIPLGALAGDDVIVAAFAEVGSGHEGAWPEGTAISPGGSWAMYLDHAVPVCTVRTIDADGGAVATSDDGARLEIPAGALAGPVDISIDPATVEEVLRHVDGSDGAFPTGSSLVTPLPAIDGVVPIEGTLWDFGPDGQEFEEPVTVTLRYDPINLPDGVAEEQLGIFVINGIWVASPSEVDLVAKTVTAQIEHFSVAFVGYQPPVEADLTVSDLFLSASSEAKVGATMDFSSSVQNLGPDASSGGTLTYQAFGDVVLGDVFGSCAEIPDPTFGAVAIRCDVAALAVDATDGIETFQLIAQSSGDVEVWATVGPAAGETDPVAENDRRTLIVPVGPAVEADLTVSDLFLSASSEAKVGATMDFSSSVQNLGPDASSGGTLTYQAFGDVVLGDVFGSCAEIPDPTFGAVAIRCDVAALAVDATDGIETFQLIAQSSGDVEVWATVGPAAGETDPVAENDRRTLIVPVGEASTGVRVQSIVDYPDPVEAGGLVNYDIDVISDDTAIDVVLHVLFTGDWTFVGSTHDCTLIANGVQCSGFDLLPGGAESIQVQVTLPTAGQTVTAEALIPTNDSPSMSTTTTVLEAGDGSF